MITTPSRSALASTLPPTAHVLRLHLQLWRLCAGAGTAKAAKRVVCAIDIATLYNACNTSSLVFIYAACAPANMSIALSCKCRQRSTLQARAPNVARRALVLLLPLHVIHHTLQCRPRYDAARVWRCSHMLRCCDIERVKHRRCSRFQPARLHLKCCRQKQRAAHSSCCSRLYYQDQAVTAADGTWTKDHKVQSAADAAAVLLLLLPHTLSHSFTLQDSLPPPPQISRKLWPLLARNKKVCCRKTYE